MHNAQKSSLVTKQIAIYHVTKQLLWVFSDVASLTS